MPIFPNLVLPDPRTFLPGICHRTPNHLFHHPGLHTFLGGIRQDTQDRRYSHQMSCRIDQENIWCTRQSQWVSQPVLRIDRQDTLGNRRGLSLFLPLFRIDLEGNLCKWPDPRPCPHISLIHNFRIRCPLWIALALFRLGRLGRQCIRSSRPVLANPPTFLKRSFRNR